MKRRGIRSFLLFPLVLIVTCGFWSTANPAWGWSDERELLVVADIENPADVAALRDVPGLIIEETYDGWAQVRLTESAYEQFKDWNLAHEIAVTDLRAWHFRNAQAACVPCGDWHDHDWMMTQADACAADHPDICAVSDIGTSAGGYRIAAVKISDNVGDHEDEPAVLFEGSVHGNEVVGAEVNVHMMNYLTDNFGLAPDVNFLIEEREIYFLFSTNPDGLCACSRYNDNGVDLNRDSGFGWHHDGSSPAPLSQPESRAIWNTWRGRPFAFSTSWHGGDEVFLYAWSFTHEVPLDVAEYEFLGADYVGLHPYIDDYEQGVGLYALPYHGSTKDTAYGSFGSLAWTIELSTIKAPDFATRYASYMADNESTVLRLIDLAGAQGLEGVVTDADTSGPLAATIEVNGRMIAYADPDNGAVHRFLLPGIYDLIVRANGYEPAEMHGVTVNANQLADISVALEPEDEPRAYLHQVLYNFSSVDEATAEQGFFVLGPPDGRAFPIGIQQNLSGLGATDSFLVADFGAAGLGDASGDDFAVFDGDATDAEPYSVFASTGDAFGPWTLVGEGAGTQAFDLADAPLAAVRYLKIAHRETVRGKADDNGLELDAVGTPTTQANFLADVTQGPPPLTVRFTDHSVGSPTSWAWDFGDGGSSTETDPEHVYAEDGVYTVSLSVVGPLGGEYAYETDYIVVASEFPAASFDAQPKNGLPPLDVSFLNFSTGTIDETRWDFGDGETSAETEPAHRYTAAGTYTVSLTVSGPAGSDNAVMDGMIVVGCPAPEADFNYGPDEGPAPLTVDFANATDSVEGCGTAALWDFGDGGEGSGNEIRHTYAEPGVYSVGLLVSTPGGSDHAFKNNIIKVGVDGSSDDLDDDADDDDDDDGGGGACGCSS